MTVEEYARIAEQGTDQLVLRHAPLVKRIACHMMARLPANVMLDDLVQAGMLGLLDAARRSRPTPASASAARSSTS